MKVLVTGGAGYIGTHTCVELLNAGHEVFVIDNLCNGHEIALKRVRDITNCDLQFFNDGSYFESETNSKIRMEADVDLKNKYQIRKDFVFKTIKKCYGKGNWMGSQGNILKKNFILLEEITSKYFN